MNVSEISREYKILAAEGEIQSHAVDGLDGSGKGSSVRALAHMISERGNDVLVVELPYYQSPWGKVLRRLLTESDEGLRLEERMSVYALNRLETVPSIQHIVVETYRRNRRLVEILYDRFVTSNALTLAYYNANNPSFIPDMLDHEVPRAYRLMWEFDHDFGDLLDVHKTPVFIPMLDPHLALGAVDADKSREGRDLYETASVQQLAHEIYRRLSEIDPEKIILVPQLVSDAGGGLRRLDQSELAGILLQQARPDLSGMQPIEQVGQVLTLEVNSQLTLNDRMAILVSNNDAGQLRRVDSYK